MSLNFAADSSPICDDIAGMVNEVSDEQEYLFFAYRDAQSASDYQAMAEITQAMSDNFQILANLEQASYENDCCHCGGGW